MTVAQLFPILFVACIAYAGIVYGVRWLWPGHYLTPFFVVGGNTIIVFFMAAIYGQQVAVDLFLLNIAAGVPMIVGYYVWFLAQRKRRSNRETL